ncbi:unnamed protein product [Leptosia nina]|uniref:Uncharacterized protein n=1 Tax=Leptosia nina TaxID=320188 RepID=A0AAV1JMX9_9NEOP
MSSNQSDWDVVSIIIALVVFVLPLTLLLPDFSLWDVLPKIRVMRYHIISQNVTPMQLNSAFIVLQLIFFFLFLEIRKRRLQEMVDSVLYVARATETTMDEERLKQVAAVRVCVELLDASTEHYENLILLRDEFRRRDQFKIQHPPFIEPSTSNI